MNDSEKSFNTTILILIAINLFALLILILWHWQFVWSSLLIDDTNIWGGSLVAVSALGLYFFFIGIFALFSEMLFPTPEKEKYLKRLKILRKKYTSSEVYRLLRDEARAEYKLEEARNALKQVRK